MIKDAKSAILYNNLLIRLNYGETKALPVTNRRKNNSTTVDEEDTAPQGASETDAGAPGAQQRGVRRLRHSIGLGFQLAKRQFIIGLQQSVRHQS